MSSEGTFTVAYPMALIARAFGDDAMMRDALQQCRHRVTLFDGATFWHTLDEDGQQHDRNWARGNAVRHPFLTATQFHLPVAVLDFSTW